MFDRESQKPRALRKINSAAFLLR